MMRGLGDDGASLTCALAETLGASGEADRGQVNLAASALAGLGNGDVLVILEAEADVTSTRTNQGHPTTAAGTYYRLVSYSGDDINNPASHACSASGEVTVVNPAQPLLATVPKPLPNDDATLSGGFGTLSGNLTFEVHATANCSGDAIYEEQ